MFGVWQIFKDDQGKNCRFLQSVMCGVISFSTTGRVLLQQVNIMTTLVLICQTARVYNPIKSQFHLFLCSFRAFRLINIYYFTNKCTYK